MKKLLLVLSLLLLAAGCNSNNSGKISQPQGQQPNTQNQNNLNSQGKSEIQPPSTNLGSTATPVHISANTESLFGTMIAFNVNDATMGMSGSIQKGWVEFIKDNSAYQALLSNLQKLIQDRTKLVKATGFAFDRSSFVYFTWNVIEPQKGQFDWGMTDIYAKGATNAGVKISAVIQPFAAWDQGNTQVNANCKMLDAAYYDYKAGPPNDITEYENFLTKTVDRYKQNVAVWEIGNENDAQCGGYENNPQGYFDLLKITSQAIKKADPEAKVVNGGASGHSDNSGERNFWTKFFQLGGGRYIDYFNLHYNDERGASPKLDPAAFQRDLAFWNDLMDKNGGRKPLYLTEFGIYSGSPSSQPVGGGQPTAQNSSSQVAPNQNQNGQAPPPPPAGQSVPGPSQIQTNLPMQQPPPGQSPNPPLNGKCGDGICDAFEKQSPNSCPQDCGGGSMPGGNLGQPSGQAVVGPTPPVSQPSPSQPSAGQTLPNESADSQAALYFKEAILAFANGVKVIFIDLVGPNDSIVGSSMAFNTNGQPRLFLTTLKTIAGKISGFSDVKEIAAGQYKFTVSGKTIYALWSGTLPSEVLGQVKVTNIKGQEQNTDALKIKLNADQPVIIELPK